MNDYYIPQILTGVLAAMVLFFIFDYSSYKVYGDIPVEQKINELQWRIEELEHAAGIR